MADAARKPAGNGGEHADRRWRQRARRRPITRYSTAGSSAGASKRGTLGRLRARIQRFLGFMLMRASARARNVVRSGEPIRARARLESARIEERYYYNQEISLNAEISESDAPTGHIELVLPYDGDRFFTRQAYRDVVRARRSGADPDADALVGFLALTAYENTDLDGLLNLRDNYGSVPIRVHLPPLPGPHEVDPLVADGSACVVSYDYRPRTQQLKVCPVSIEIELDDPDTGDFPRPAAHSDPAAAGSAPAKSGADRLRFMRHVSFKPDLSLRMSVSLHVSRALADGALAQVSKVSMGWPTHTSLGSLDLRVDRQVHPFWYNPEFDHGARKGGLEWSGVSMTLEQEPIGGEIRTFVSPEMELSIPQPGELYRETSLNGRIEVTIDRLLSAMDARLYNATGKICSQGPEMKSVVSADFSLRLYDAFAQRTLSPYQQLYFGEVIPSKMRIDDIITALGNRGFTVKDPPTDPNPEDCWLSAERVHGPDTLTLDLYVAGEHYKAVRHRRVPGGMSYQTEVDSGELRIYVYGYLPKDSLPVIREMNALRRALHERFDRLPAWR